MITGLNAVSEKIDEAFGRPPAFTSQPLSQADISVLDRIFGDVGYAVYADDEINRSVIKNFLINALLQGHLEDEGLELALAAVATPQHRSEMALKMIVHGIGDAEALVRQAAVEFEMVPGQEEQAAEPRQLQRVK